MQWSRHSDLALNLIHKDLTVRYAGSSFGVLWSFGNPVVTTFVYWLVFTRIFPASQPGFALYIVCGVVHWSLLAQVVPHSCEWLTSNANLLRKISFPRLLIPAAGMGTLVLCWIPALLVLGAVSLAMRGTLPSTLLIYPLVLATYVVFLFGTGLCLSILYIDSRDLRHLCDVGVPLLFWMTPVVWTPVQLPAAWSSFLSLNPVTPFFQAFSAMLYDMHAPARDDLITCTVIAVLTLTVGLSLFCLRAPDIVERL